MTSTSQPGVPASPSLDDIVLGLGQRVDKIAAAVAKYQTASDDASSRHRELAAQHMNTTLPALSDLAAAARFFWAGMLQATDGIDGLDGEEPDEEDVERAVCEVEKSLAAFATACETGLRLLTEEGVDLDAIKGTEIEAMASRDVARQLWVDINERQIPGARQLLDGNMARIEALEKDMSRLVAKVNKMTSQNEGVVESMPKDDAGRIQSCRLDLKDTLEEHKVLAQGVTALVCQATAVKATRDAFHFHAGYTRMLLDSHADLVAGLNACGKAAGGLLDAVKEVLSKLEWTDVEDSGSFPAEELLKLSARLLVYATELDQKWLAQQHSPDNVLAVLEGTQDGPLQGPPLPVSVTEILQVLKPHQPSRDGTPSQASQQTEATNPPAQQPRRTPTPTPQPSSPPLRIIDPTALETLDPMPLDEDAPAPPGPPQLQLLGASWGGADVTAKLAARIKDNRLVIDVHKLNDTLGDPMPYKTKHLTGLYRFGTAGEPRLFIIGEQLPLFSSSVFVITPPDHTRNPSNRLSIPVAGSGFTMAGADGFDILAVTYGPRHVRNASVLANLAEYFSGRAGRVYPDNDFFRGDPWPWHAKSWTVFVRFAADGGGRVRTVTGAEGTGMDKPWVLRPLSS